MCLLLCASVPLLFATIFFWIFIFRIMKLNNAYCKFFTNKTGEITSYLAHQDKLHLNLKKINKITEFNYLIYSFILLTNSANNAINQLKISYLECDSIFEHIPLHTVIHIPLPIFTSSFESKYYLYYKKYHELSMSFSVFLED